MRNIKIWLSQHNFLVGLRLYIIPIWIILFPSIAMGVVLDKGTPPGTQKSQSTSVPGRVNTQAPTIALGQHTNADQRPQYVPGEVLVKFKKGVDASKKKSTHDKMDASVLTEISAIGVQKVKSKFGKSTEDLVRQYKNDPDVLYAEPNGLYYIQALPNDPKFPNLWGLNNTGQIVAGVAGNQDADIDAPEAWGLFTGTANTIVADIDTGVDYTHPDIAANMWVNPGEIAGNGRDDDANGYVDDVYGWNFIYGNNNPMDDHGHGTHVAGTIAASGNNGIGVTGISWRARIMALKICNSGGGCSFSAAAQAVLYAARMGAKVSNNSYGGLGAGAFSQTLLDAINVANGMLFVAAAGNDNNDNDKIPTYPCNLAASNVLCVAATGQDDSKASFSSYGLNSVDLAAPGVNILSTVPSAACELCEPSGYRYLQGTSMAAPHVTGAAVLTTAMFPTLSVSKIKNVLMGSVDANPFLMPRIASGGRLNVNRALRSNIILSTSPSTIAVPAGQSGATSVSVQSLKSFSGSVTFSLAEDYFSGLSGSISPSTVSLAANGSATTTLTAVITAGIAAGDYPMTVQAAYVNALGQIETRQSVVIVTVQTDLAVTALNSTTVQAGGWFTVTDTVQNQGAGIAKRVYVGYYLSTDNVITDADVRIGSRWLASLSPGATSVGNVDVWVPESLGAGDYYLGAIADDLHRISDSSTANNSKVANMIAIAGSASPSPAWVSRYSDPGNNGNDGGGKIVVDTAGNSIVAGVACARITSDGNCDFDITTIKYSPDGTALWTVIYDSGVSDRPTDMTTDGAGNIYISTISWINTVPTTTTIKYDANGNVLWTTPVHYAFGSAAALTVDGLGNLYVTGGGCENYANYSSGCFLTTIKYGANGNKVWARQEPAQHLFTGGRDIAVDGAGNVYVTGDEIGYGYATIKYGPNGGAPLWYSHYSGDAYARALALDTAGNVYVSGTNRGFIKGASNIVTVKYDNNGNQLWATSYDNGGDDTLGWWNEVFGLIATDAAGNVYVTGVSSNGLNKDYVTIKYDTSGKLLWSARYDSGKEDIPWLLAINSSRIASVTGSKGKSLSGPTTVGSATVKYGSDGHPQWFGSYDTKQFFSPSASALDSLGNVIITGTHGGITGAYPYAFSYLTLKFSVQPDSGQPDLVITAVSTNSTSLLIGGKTTVNTTVLNRGSGETSVSSTVGIYLSTDATITTADTMIGSRTLAPQAAGDASTAGSTLTIPLTLASGIYYLGAIADVYGEQSESSEANNTLAGASMPVTIPIQVTRADLIMTSVIPGIMSGSTLPLTNTVKNIGTAATTASFTITYRLSLNTIYGDADDVVVATTRSVVSLAAGASNMATTSLTIPATTKTGNYYVCAKADATNTNIEANENNNTRCSTTTIAVPPPDLVMSALSTTATTVAKGASFLLANTVKNQGGSRAGAFAIRFVLSSNTVIGDADDIALTPQRSLAGLNVGISIRTLLLVQGLEFSSIVS